MFKLENALCLGKSLGSYWEYHDLSEVMVYAAYQDFKQFFLILSHPSLPNLVNVDMSEVRISSEHLNLSFTEWLLAIGDASLPFTEKLPNSQLRQVKYANAQQMAYDVNIATAGLYLPDGVTLQSHSDLKITRTQFLTDMQLMEKYCLCTVSGYVHKTVSDINAAYILGGARTAARTKQHTVGIMSFIDVGALKCIDLNDGIVEPFEYLKGGTLYEKIRVTINEDLTDKSYFLVLGGYMVFPKEGVFQQVGDKSFMLDLQTLNLEERVLESYKHLELDKLMKFVDGTDVIDMEHLRSEQFLVEYVRHRTTFLVIVDAPNYQFKKHYVQRASFPGQFLMYSEPQFPLIGPYGKVLDYWKTEENGMWTMDCLDTFHRQYIFTEGPRTRALVGTNSIDVTRRYQLGHAYLAEISTIKE